eukprot:gene57332-biopygen50605
MKLNPVGLPSPGKKEGTWFGLQAGGVQGPKEGAPPFCDPGYVSDPNVTLLCEEEGGVARFAAQLCAPAPTAAPYTPGNPSSAPTHAPYTPGSPSKTPSPTTAATTSPTVPTGCTDLPLPSGGEWHDPDGSSCAIYGRHFSSGICASAGVWFANEGMVASTACCVCGGGQSTDCTNSALGDTCDPGDCNNYGPCNADNGVVGWCDGSDTCATTSLFVRGNDGANACPGSSSPIISKAGCSDAAAALGLKFVARFTANAPTEPKGCYQKDATPPHTFVIANALRAE